MLELLYDARRFVLKFRYIAGAAPLQLYISGLIFAPTRSATKKSFLKEKPDWISVSRNIEDNWDAHLQTLEGHKENVDYIAFSSDGLLLASCAKDKTINIWEIATGTLRQTFTGHENSILCVAFSLDTQTLASISVDAIMKFWDVATGASLWNIKLQDDEIWDACFSPDISLLATHSRGKAAIWDLYLGVQKHELGKTSLFILQLSPQMDCYSLVPQTGI